MLPLFFISDLKSPQLIGDNAHHANRVLRMKIGEELLVSDGKGGWASCEITNLDKHSISLKANQLGFEPAPQNLVSVVQALPKSDRAKEAVELLTASGVAEIYPWRAERSIGRDSDKWESVAIEASKQCRRFVTPVVHTQINTNQVITLFSSFEQVLICHESAVEKISDVVKPATKTLIVIGPEGGITEDELVIFRDGGGKVIKLGRPVLRSAHAGLAAVSAVSALMRVW